MAMLTKEMTVPKPQLLDYYRQMLLIRRFEEKAAEMYTRGRIGGFLHLYIGEEAIAVGTISALRRDDYIVTHYRDHGHALARGLDPKAMMAELFGKATGTSKGKGGSMHMFDVSKGLLGGYAIVGAMMPIAAGLGMASKRLKQDRIVFCYFGDGAVNEGEFHESLNLSALWGLPVVFICENNGYGMGTAAGKTISSKDIYRLAAAYEVKAKKIDGMDVLAAREAAQEAVDYVRGGNGPFFLEMTTYRFRGHSMADPMDYRKKAEETRWRKRDPLLTYPRHLLDERIASEDEMKRMEQEVEQVVEEAVKFAEESPFPAAEALYQDVQAKE